MVFNCLHCGADISHRYNNATHCFPCLNSWADRVGARAAYKQVNRAIRAGDIPKPTDLNCADCGGPARDYDHRDYNKPLEVDPVCRSCNKLRGPAIHVATTTEA
jgi:hypothetical protein